MDSHKPGEKAAKGNRGGVQASVMAALQYGLMSGLLVPGQIMSLRKLATSFGTSPMPVRESLSRLVAANALEEMPNRSVRVPRLDTESLKEIFELRVRVEGMAARIAATKVMSGDITELREINRRVKQAHKSEEIGKLLRLNQQFHFTLYRLTNSTILLPIIEGLWLRCGPTMYFSLGSPGLWDSSSHIAIIDGLERGDPSATESALTNDIMRTGNYLIKQSSRGITMGPTAELSFELAEAASQDNQVYFRASLTGI